MIQTNPQSETISGYFGLSQERKDELDKQFKEIRIKQNEEVRKDIIKSFDESGFDKIGYRCVPVIDAFMQIAQTPAEQAYCAFMVQYEIDRFTDLMNMAVHGSLIRSILK